MYYPTKPGSYPPLIFLGGFYDVMGTKFYHTFLNEIAQHGYMVFGIDMFPWKGEANHKDVKLLRRPLTVLESHVYHEVENPIGLPDFFKQMTWVGFRYYIILYCNQYLSQCRKVAYSRVSDKTLRPPSNPVTDRFEPQRYKKYSLSEM